MITTTAGRMLMTSVISALAAEGGDAAGLAALLDAD